MKPPCLADRLGLQTTTWVVALATLLGGSAARAAAAQAAAADPSKASGGQGYSQNDIFRFMEEENVTTGTQLETKLREVPQPVYVITADEIERLAPTNLADLLRFIPGAVVVQPTDSQWSVSEHTEPYTVLNNYLLVLIDGRPAYAAFANITQWWSLPVDPEDIARVEVALGPSSTLYGAQAVFGVINFITKKPHGTHTDFVASGGGSVGTHNDVRLGDAHLHLSRSQPIGASKLRLAAGYQRLTPWSNKPIYSDGRLVPPRGGQRGILNARLETPLGHATTLTVLAGGNVAESDYVVFDRGFFRGANEYLDARINHKGLWLPKDRLEVTANARTRQINYASDLDPSLPAIHFDVNEVVAMARAQYIATLPHRNRFVGGAELTYTYAGWDVIEPRGRSRGSAALFVQDEYRPWEPLIFTAGLRLEKQQTAATGPTDRLEPIPRLSVVWLPANGQTLRLSFGEGVYYPSPLEDFGNLTLYNGRMPLFVSDIQPPDLHMYGFEAGYRGQLLRSLVVTASYTLWLNHNLFWIEPEGAGPLPLHMHAIAGTELRQSFDFTASWRPTERFRWDFIASTVFGNRKPPGIANRTGGDPPYHFVSRLHLTPVSRLNLDLAGTLVAPRTARALLTGQPSKVAGWLDVDIHVSWQLTRKPALEVFAVGTNVTDTVVGQGLPRQLPEAAVSRPGRRILIGLRGGL